MLNADGRSPPVACSSIVFDNSSRSPGNHFRTVRIIALSLLAKRPSTKVGAATRPDSRKINERAGSPAIFELMSIHFLVFVL